MFYLTTHSTHFIYGNPLLSHGLLFLISSKGSFICTIPDRIAYTTAVVSRELRLTKHYSLCVKGVIVNQTLQFMCKGSYS